MNWRKIMLVGLLASGLGMSGSAAAAGRQAPWQGTVTHVTDGDTLWVQPARGGAPRKIRLEGVDAPEICQAYGGLARERLAHHVLGQQVRVMARRKDDYNRVLARLSLRGQDIGGWMVTQGLAWSHRYRRDAGPYAAQEAQARAQRRGVFGEARPERPRDFRKRHGACH